MWLNKLLNWFKRLTSSLELIPEWTIQRDENGVDCSPNHPDVVSQDIIKGVWKVLIGKYDAIEWIE